MQAQVDNRKEIRSLIYQIFSNPEQLAQLKGELEAYASTSCRKIPAGRRRIGAVTRTHLRSLPMAEPTSVSTRACWSKLLSAAQFEDKKPLPR